VIDNGASLYFHHDWDNWENHLTRTFPLIKDHVLLPQASKLDEAAKKIKQLINADKITEIISLLPEEWLISESNSLSAATMRDAYAKFISVRLSRIDELVKEAADAR
jgi:hypothetical protein